MNTNSTSELTTLQRVARLVPPLAMVAVLALHALAHARPRDLESVPPPPVTSALGHACLVFIAIVTPWRPRLGSFFRIVGAIFAVLLSLFVTIEWQEW